MVLSLMVHCVLKAGMGVARKMRGFDGRAFSESTICCMSPSNSAEYFQLAVFESLVPSFITTISGLKASASRHASSFIYGWSPLLSMVRAPTPKFLT